jgi:hypothetical protein
MNFYKGLSYDFVSITDHDYVTPDPGVSGILFILGDEDYVTAPIGNAAHLKKMGISVTDQSLQAAQTTIDLGTADSNYMELNHPGGGANGWETTDIEQTNGYFGMEIWNGIRNDEFDTEIDTVLTKGKKLWVSSVDDLHDISAGYAGKQAVKVYANSLTASNILDSLKAGNFYSVKTPSGQTEHVLTITQSGNTITISTNQSSTFEWYSKGSIIQTNSSTTSASYTITGTELYIRCRITGGTAVAWTNPIFVDLIDDESSRNELVRGNSYIKGVQNAYNFVSTVAVGTQPYATTSTTLNTNLNADMLDGVHYSDFSGKLVTNGDSHDHNGGDGAQINHTTLSNIGTNTHAQIDSFIAAVPTTYLKLDASNDPITGDLNLTPTANSTTTFQIFQQGGTTQVLNVDTTNQRTYFGITGGTASITTNTQFYQSVTDPTADIYCIYAENYCTATAAANAKVPYAGYFLTRSLGTQNWTGAVRGLYALAQHSGTGTSTNNQGVRFVARNISTGIVTNNFGLAMTNGNTSTGTITNMYHIDVDSVLGGAGSAITTNMALHIRNQKSAYITSPWAIYSDNGWNHLGQYLEIVGSEDILQFKVKGYSTQTTNLSEWQNSSAQVLVSFDGVGGAIFNEQGAATADFRVESDTEPNMIFLDANGDTDGALWLGGTTNGIKITKGGEMTFEGTATVWNDVVVNLLTVKVSSTNPPTWTAYKSSEAPAFSATVTNVLYFNVQIPHNYKEGSDIGIHIHVAYPDATSGNSRWTLTYSWANADGTFPTATSETLTFAAPAVADKHVMHAFSNITGTGKTVSSILLCSLSRLGADAADTYGNVIYGISADFHVEMSCVGSKTA